MSSRRTRARSALRIAPVALALIVSAPAHAQTVWNESINGDLSPLGTVPSSVGPLAAGSNKIFGVTGKVSQNFSPDRDYFVITIPSGFEFVGLGLLTGTTVGSGGTFIGMQSGSQVTVATNAATKTGLLGWVQYTAADVSTNLFTKMSVANNGSSGFTAPLGPGDYAFWIEDNAVGSFSYGLDVQLATTTAPEPATWALMAMGLAGLGVVTRRRARGAVASRLV